MRHRRLALTLLACVAVAAPAAQAQQTGGGLGGLSGLMGGGGAAGSAGLLGGLMPNIGSVGAGNAAGLLGYCVRNKISDSTSALTSTLQGLTAKPGVTGSKSYAAGQQGTLVAGNGQTLSLDGLKGKVKTRLCDMVLQHAKTML